MNKRSYSVFQEGDIDGYDSATSQPNTRFSRSGGTIGTGVGTSEGEIDRAGVIRTYRRYAPVYDWIFGAALQPGRRALASAVGASNARSVLEVGVGTGLTLPHYPEHCRLVGIDLCPEMLAKARSRTPKCPSRDIALEAMDAEDIRFPDAAFDCVTIPYVLSVTPHPERLVAEVRRVCRKDGMIFILNHFSGSRFWRSFETVLRPLAERIGFRSQFDFDEHILSHDWEVIDVQKVNLLALSRLVAIRNS